jgi:hypothetical protein
MQLLLIDFELCSLIQFERESANPQGIESYYISTCIFLLNLLIIESFVLTNRRDDRS